MKVKDMIEHLSKADPEAVICKMEPRGLTDTDFFQIENVH